MHPNIAHLDFQKAVFSSLCIMEVGTFFEVSYFLMRRVLKKKRERKKKVIRNKYLNEWDGGI